MKILIDTHIFLWWLSEPHCLKKKELTVLEDPENMIYVSSVVTWEIIIKRSLKKLIFRGDIKQSIIENSFIELPISVDHTLQLEKIPTLHHDPFDRLLVAQAQFENLGMMSHDAKIKQYEVKLI